MAFVVTTTYAGKGAGELFKQSLLNNTPIADVNGNSLSTTYFHKNDNGVYDQEMVAVEFEKVAGELLNTNKPKNWFRAYFNMGLARKVRNLKRALPCEVGTDMFFLDPFANVLPCNGSEEPMIMGNLQQQTFTEIWHSEAAEKVRESVKNCPRQCWMIGSAAPAMKKSIAIPLKWVIKNKLRAILRGKNRPLSSI